jgi:hypothetical protein
MIYLHYQIRKYLQFLLWSHQEVMSIGATAKHVQQLIVLFCCLCQQKSCPIEEEEQKGSNRFTTVVHMGSLLYP